MGLFDKLFGKKDKEEIEEQIDKEKETIEKESNKIHMVENFKKVTDDGGWNYNIKTCEIHVNLPYNFFEQGIDWKNY